MDVAVIGAGAAGLITAQALIAEGMAPTLFEQQPGLGGTWRYNPRTEDDASGRNPSERLHGSMYASLRTNLPRSVMAIPGFPFEAVGEHVHAGDYAHHREVQAYLERFADSYDLEPLIRYNARVQLVQRETQGWRVQTTAGLQRFDAVAVANGHYFHPRLPAIAALENFRGRQIHAHNYRQAEDVPEARVLVWGTSASGEDLALELWRAGREVVWAGEGHGAIAPRAGFQCRPSPARILPDGAVELSDGSDVQVDAILFCTGYAYRFDFLDQVQVEDNWVRPLYEQCVHVEHPSLALIGVPFLVIPFPLIHAQARWWARSLVGAFDLPDAMARAAAEREWREDLRRNGVLQRHYHKLGAGQTAYINRLNAQCGAAPLSDEFVRSVMDARARKLADPEGYRDPSGN